MASENAEEVRVRKAIVDCAVDHYDLLANAQAANASAATLSSSAEDAAQGLSNALHTLQSSSQLLGLAGQSWRQEKSQLRSAVMSHQKIVALMEAPALVEECVRHNMFHEALLIFEHVMMLCQHMSDVYVFQRLQEEVVDAMQLVVEGHVLPMLAGPLSVDAAYKAISLLRRLGGSADFLRSLFLTSRATYIAQLMQEADASIVPYSRILKYVTVYKVHVSEVTLQYKACFPSNTETQQLETAQELGLWCQEQADNFVALMSAALQHLHNGAELALVIQQCSSCATTTQRVHTDVSGLLGSVLVGKVQALFSEGMRQARVTYRTAMQTSSWRVSVFCHHNTSLTASTVVEAATTVGDTPSVQLAQWLPLAYAMNGTLSSFNAIRKCLLPGVEASCEEEVLQLVIDIAQDMLNDVPLLDTMDAAEKGVFVTFVKAFRRLYYPYMAHLVGRLLGPVHRDAMEDRLQGVLHDVDDVLFLVDPPTAPTPATSHATAAPAVPHNASAAPAASQPVATPPVAARPQQVPPPPPVQSSGAPLSTTPFHPPTAATAPTPLPAAAGQGLYEPRSGQHTPSSSSSAAAATTAAASSAGAAPPTMAVRPPHAAAAGPAAAMTAPPSQPGVYAAPPLQSAAAPQSSHAPPPPHNPFA